MIDFEECQIACPMRLPEGEGVQAGTEIDEPLHTLVDRIGKLVLHEATAEHYLRTCQAGHGLLKLAFIGQNLLSRGARHGSK